MPGSCYHIWCMTKTTVYLEPDVVMALRQMAAAEGRPQAELIRDALKDFTRRRKRVAIPGVGGFDSGRADGSAEAEVILRKASRAGKWRRQVSRGAHR